MNILLVSDDTLMQWSVTAMLSDAGHVVVEASDGAAAVRTLAGAPEPFDVVLLDHQLPDANNLELLRQLRQQSPTTAVVLMTAFGTPDVVTRALSFGACRVVDKPFDMREIDSVVRAARAHEHTVECGDHVCAILSSVDELANLAADWIAEGLGRNERCWYVAAADEAPAIHAALCARRIDYEAEAQRGAFNIVGASAAYLVDGVFNPERTIQIFSDTVEQAVRDGFSGFRAAADMSWALELSDGAERLIAYEAMLKSMFATHRVTGLCLYHRTRTPAKVLKSAMATHPVAGIGGRYSLNPFYDARVTSIDDVDEQHALAVSGI